MNKQIAIIKDAVRNSPHVMIVKDGDSTICKSLTTYGESLLSSCYRDGEIIEQFLPAGFVSTGFHQLTPALEQVSGIKFNGNTKSLDDHELRAPDNFYSGQRLRDRKVLKSTMKNPPKMSVVDIKINRYRFSDTKTSAVAFKAAMFKKRIKQKKMLTEMKQKSMSFNPRNNTIVASKSLDGLNAVVSNFISQWGTGTIRRAMKQKTLNKSASTSRRAARRAEVLVQISREENEIKSTISRFLS